MDVLLLLWALASALLLLFVTLVLRHGVGRVDGKLPPSPPGWPIIGHLHLLAKLPHQVMANLAKTYGPIIYLRLGSKPALFISSPQLARHFLQLHDNTFSNRPPNEFDNLVFHRKSFMLMNSGQQEWKDIRRICSTVVFHPKIWNSSESLRMEEVASMLKAVAENQERPIVNLAKICADFTSHTMGRLLFTDARHTKHIADITQLSTVLFATPVIGDFIPWLRCLDWRTKQEMKLLGLKIDSMFGRLIDERRNEINRQSPDFLDALLSAKEDDRFPSYIDDESVVHTCMDILGASTETTATALEWAMAELLANPSELKLLQEEIDRVVPSQHMVNSADLQNMSYLKAIVKETLRLHPPAPFLIPHASLEVEVEVGSYTIPPNCTLFVNVWAMGRDPSIWDNPLHFYPPRFLDGQGMVAEGNIEDQFQLIPFGAGRRRCPGAAIAVAMVELGLSNLVHAFQWALPPGIRPHELDMVEKHGVTTSRLHPLCACPTPRHYHGTSQADHAS